MVIKMTLFAFVILGIIVIYKLSKYNDKKKLNTVLKKDTEVENVSELINKIDEKIQNTKKELEENQEAYKNRQLVSAGLSPWDKADFDLQAKKAYYDALGKITLPVNYFSGGNGNASNDVITALLTAKLIDK